MTFFMRKTYDFSHEKHINFINFHTDMICFSPQFNNQLFKEFSSIAVACFFNT